MLIHVKILKKFFFQNLTRKLEFLKKKSKKLKENKFSNFEKIHINSYIEFYADSGKNNEKILFLKFDSEIRVF
jgi:hypothetical protein